MLNLMQAVAPTHVARAEPPSPAKAPCALEPLDVGPSWTGSSNPTLESLWKRSKSWVF